MDKTTVILPMIPLRGIVLYPKMVLHFDIGRPTSIAAAEYAMRHNEPLFVVTQRDAKTETPGADELYNIEMTAKVRQILRLPGDDVRVLVEGIRRASLIALCDDEKILRRAEIEEIEIAEAPLSLPENEAHYRRIQQLL